MHALPSPSAAAVEHSQSLSSVIRDTIQQAGGWIPFDQYMHMALYQPGLGYYSAGAKKFGAVGDFVTAPELSDLFGRCLAQPILQVLQCAQFAENTPAILELGAGQGKLAAQILLALQQAGLADSASGLPAYYILEVSAHLREVQQQTLSALLPPELYGQIHWLERLPQTWHGVILANEVLDALPIKQFRVGAHACHELGVTLDANQNMLISEQVESQAHALPCAIQQQFQLPAGYIIETCANAQALVQSLADCLQQGFVLLIDYGFDAATYYHAQRHEGTLMCHYRHYAHHDPFYYPGLQDITAHVTFTAIAQAACDASMQLVGYLPQANFLLNCGILDTLAEQSETDSKTHLRQTAAVQTLLSPAEMGELFKVIAFEKGIDMPDYRGFQSGDQSFRL